MTKRPELQTEASAEGWDMSSQEACPTRSGGHHEGASLSNTAPYSCNSETRILRVGVDSLYLTYPGSISEETSIRLKTLKELAQSPNTTRTHLAQWQCGEHIFQVQDRGRSIFAFILQDPWFRIEVSSLGAVRAPLAYCRLASQPLTFEGPSAVEQELRTIIEALGQPEDEANVARADLCVDFVTNTNIGGITEREWVSRARNFSQHSVARQFSGWSVGQGGDLSCRLYNKLLEIEKSGKTYMFDIWKDAGWDGSQIVWRLEFQYRREALRELDVKTMSQFLEKLGGLWCYASEQWLRLTIPSDTDTTQSRWPLHPMWEALTQADWGVESKVAKRSPPKRLGPSDRHLFLNGLSPLTSFMARERITDVDEGIHQFFARARDYHLQQVILYSGVDFEGYVLDKVSQKAREYSSMKNSKVAGVPDPGDKAVAREYRKRSDG